jgi:hypothetical protein
VDPISLILSALAAGAAAASQDAASDAVKSAYQRLRGLVRRRLASRQQEAALDAYDQDGEAGAEALRASLAETGAEHDQELLDVARVVIAAPARQTNLQFNAPVNGLVAGDHNQVRMNFGPAADD